jgi:predicted lactoylglutathione lyase
MPLTHAKFREFTPRAICDATKSTEVLVCLSRENYQPVSERGVLRPASRTPPGAETWPLY